MSQRKCFTKKDRCNDCPVDYPEKECANYTKYNTLEPATNPRVTISFKYIDDSRCSLNNEIFPGQCCCKCSYRVKVVAHCLHVNEIPPESCNCGNEMGFYVCTVFDEMEPRSGTASVCGTHGLCECFTKREELEIKEPQA